MKIYTLHLKEPVTLTGRDFFGFQSRITLRQNYLRGWGWSRNGDGSYLPINPRIMAHKNRRIRFQHEFSVLEVIEHIMPLRLLFPSLIIEGSGWPPYDGCSRDLWEAARDKSRTIEVEIPIYSTSKKIEWTYPDRRAGIIGHTTLHPATSPGLQIEVKVKYAQLGETSRKYIIHPGSLEQFNLAQLFRVGAQGIWPKPLRILAKLIGWPHYNNIVWPDSGNARQVIRSFADHRCLDILGGLVGPLCKDGLLAGRIESEVSGHEADYHVARQAFTHLKRIA